MILTNPARLSRFANDPNLSMMLETLQVVIIQDIREYINLVVTGNIYKYFWDECEKRNYHITEYRELKRQFLIAIFSPNRMNSKARVVFKEVFPNFHKIFSIVRGDAKGSKFQNFRRFPILLQRIESYLVHGVALKNINEKYPDVKTLAKHDSVLTGHQEQIIKSGVLTESLEIVLAELKEVFTKFTGFEPKFKIKRTEERKERESEGERGRIKGGGNMMSDPL